MSSTRTSQSSISSTNGLLGVDFEAESDAEVRMISDNDKKVDVLDLNVLFPSISNESEAILSFQITQLKQRLKKLSLHPMVLERLFILVAKLLIHLGRSNDDQINKHVQHTQITQIVVHDDDEQEHNHLNEQGQQRQGTMASHDSIDLPDAFESMVRQEYKIAMEDVLTINKTHHHPTSLNRHGNSVSSLLSEEGEEEVNTIRQGFSLVTKDIIQHHNLFKRLLSSPRDCDTLVVNQIIHKPLAIQPLSYSKRISVTNSAKNSKGHTSGATTKQGGNSKKHKK
eukprot:m.3351 g.3351  ORF g.3351 m.3351 type:complete len:283 (-) comp2056_c0_seq1:295-1143(-)